MKQVDMYLVNCGQSPKKTEAWWGFVLEYQGKTLHTLPDFGKTEDTRNGRDLHMFLKAPTRCRECEITVHTDSYYLIGGFGRLGDYMANGWMNAKGEEVGHANTWQAIAVEARDKLTRFEYERHHTYTAWVQGEVKRKDEQLCSNSGGRSGSKKAV